MAIIISRKHIQQMCKHGEDTYPYECCGILLGKKAGDDLRVIEVLRAENVHRDSKHIRYAIAPREYLQAERLADSRGLQVVGLYHSHPDHKPKPSFYDLEHAWPSYAYLIFEVRKGQAQESYAYVMADDRSAFESQLIIIEEK